MKAISIKQPWAWAIFRKGKDIENRSWPTKVRGQVYVHVSKHLDKYAPKDLLFEYTKAALDLDPFTKGAGIIGSVEIIDCVDKSQSPWFQGRYGFVLKSPRPVKHFIPYKGQLSFF